MIQLAILLTLHFIGDFVCQTNWMAVNKSQSNWALTVHVLTYTAVFALVIVTVPRWIGVPMPGQPVLFVGVTGGLHWVTDWCTSRVTSRLWFVVGATADTRHEGYVAVKVQYDDSKRHWFFVVIGFDQLIHVWCLATAAIWCGLAPN